MTWLSEKCANYFSEAADAIKRPFYSELLFFFEEAAFASEKLKTNEYLSLIRKRIEMLRCKQQFIDKYLENAERLSTKKLDMVIELAGTEVNCVVRTLTNQLLELLKIRGSSIPVSCQYLLDNSCLYLCRKSDQALFDKLFDVLRDFPNETLAWTFDLYRKSSNKAAGGGRMCAVQSPSQSTSAIVSRNNRIPNLYHNLDMEMTADALFDWLTRSEQVDSLLMALEAVWTWNSYRHHATHINTTDQSNIALQLRERLPDIIKRRCWPLLPSELGKYEVSFLGKQTVVIPAIFKQYLASAEPPKEVNFSFRLEMVPFCSSHPKTSSYVLIDGAIAWNQPLTLLSKEATLTFPFKHPSVTSCNLPGDCGFVLKTVPSGAALRNLKLCTEKEDYISESVHFHDEIRAENMHLFFYQTDNNSPTLFPIS